MVLAGPRSHDEVTHLAVAPDFFVGLPTSAGAHFARDPRNNLRTPRCALRRTSVLSLAILLLVCLSARSTHAYDEVDAAVDAFAKGGAIIGVTIGPNEKELVKSLVRCAADAAQNKSLINCARDELIGKLPPDARPLAGCLLTGGSIPQCAQEVVLAGLPPEAQSFADCLLSNGTPLQCAQPITVSKVPADAEPIVRCLLGGGAVQQCAQTEVLSELPPDARPLAGCLLGGASLSRCAQAEGLSSPASDR